MGRVGLRVVGIVMNGGDPHVGYGYGMGRYGYGYRGRSAEPAPSGSVVVPDGSEPLAPVTTVDAVDPVSDPPAGGGATQLSAADQR
jgi:hypothetical protein